jgi:acetoin utilization protein AcuB
MHVEELMTSKVFVVEQDDYIDRVFFLLHYESIRHLPVVEKGKVIGIVSDRDLYKALGPKSNSRAIADATGPNTTELHVAPKKVRHIMRRGVITVNRDTSASEAAAIMADNKIGALPVVDRDDKLVGILSATDILRVFSKIDKASDEKEKKAQPGNKKAPKSG